MKILSKAVFREVFGSAFLGTILFTFVLFLQRLGNRGDRLFEVLVRGSAPASSVGYLFALLIPRVLIFALPVGTLVGVLIGLGRMSSDGEITAMRAAGVPSRRVVAPVLALAALSTAIAACCSLWLTPLSIREMYRVLNSIIAQQLTAQIQPRVFEGQFTSSNVVLYVGDVPPTSNDVVEWKNVFIADLTPPDQRPGKPYTPADAPLITVAPEALAKPDPANNSITLELKNARTHEMDAETGNYHSISIADSIQTLQANAPTEVSARAFESMDTGPLIRDAVDNTEGTIELHQRFALPFACLLLAVVGIPLGVSSRKSGKSAAFVLTVFLAFVYFMAFISMVRLAKQGSLPAIPAVWAPNAVFAFFGFILLSGLERPGDRDLLSRLKAFGSNLWWRLQSMVSGKLLRGTPLRIPRLPLLPGVIDTYVLSTFLFWFAMLLTSFVVMAHTFIFFELLGDVFAHDISISRDFTYHLFLTPKLIYDSSPMAVLVAVLVTFGILTKNNEITAMKACGVSLYRLSVPVIIASVFLSAGLFGFDHYYIPEANRIQDRIYNEIKGRAVQIYLRPDRTWKLSADGSTVYYYKYLDPAQRVMIGVHVYELDLTSFHLKRHIMAESARWEPTLKSWIFQNGWAFDIVHSKNTSGFQARVFPELSDDPSYFLQENKQEAQLNFLELEDYIRDLEHSGFDTVRLKVQLQKKFSVPAFALIMALIALPFAFLTGNRGAMAGVGVSLGIAIAYYAVSRVFEEVGNVDQLSAPLAAWSPDALFALAALYLFSRVRT